MVVLTVTIWDLAIGKGLQRCSIAILRLGVVLMTWVCLLMGLLLVVGPIGLVWWGVVGLTGLWGHRRLPGGGFSGRGHV